MCSIVKWQVHLIIGSTDVMNKAIPITSEPNSILCADEAAFSVTKNAHSILTARIPNKGICNIDKLICCILLCMVLPSVNYIHYTRFLLFTHNLCASFNEIKIIANYVALHL